MNVKLFLLRDPQVSPRVKATIRYGHGGGLDRLVYGDLTGDGQADVVAPVFSGGTAGDIAFYVLSRRGRRAPRDQASNQEYKIGVRIVRGHLQVTRPYTAAPTRTAARNTSRSRPTALTGVRLVSASKKRIKTPG